MRKDHRVGARWLLLAALSILAVSLLLTGTDAWAAENNGGPDDEKLLDDAVARAKARESRDRFLANHHFKAGVELYDVNRFQEAKVEFAKALEYNKNHKEAREYLTKTESLLGLKSGVWADMQEQFVAKYIIARQIAMVELNNRFEEAKADYSAGRFDKAIGGFQRVSELIKYIEPYEDVSKWKASTADYMDKAKTGLLKKQEEEAAQRRAEALALSMMREAERKEFLTNRIQTLLTQGRQLYKASRFEEARDKFNAVTNIDPENEQAYELADAARIAAVDAWMLRNAKNRIENTTVNWELVDEFAIPQNSPKLYKVLWYDVDKWFSRVITREPILGGTLPDEKAPWKQAIREKLQEPVTFDFIDTPLEDVIHFLRQLTDLTIVLDPKAMEALDITEITLKVTDMKLEEALRWILNSVDLKWTLQDNAVYISDTIEGEAIRLLYDVTDLTFEVRDFRGDLRHLRTRTGTSVSGEGGGGGEDDIFADQDFEDDTGEDITGQGLVDFIVKTIAPGTWEEVE